MLSTNHFADFFTRRTRAPLLCLTVFCLTIAVVPAAATPSKPSIEKEMDHGSDLADPFFSGIASIVRQSDQSLAYALTVYDAYNAADIERNAQEKWLPTESRSSIGQWESSNILLSGGMNAPKTTYPLWIAFKNALDHVESYAAPAVLVRRSVGTTSISERPHEVDVHLAQLFLPPRAQLGVRKLFVSAGLGEKPGSWLWTLTQTLPDSEQESRWAGGRNGSLHVLVKGKRIAYAGSTAQRLARRFNIAFASETARQTSMVQLGSFKCRLKDFSYRGL